MRPQISLEVLPMQNAKNVADLIDRCGGIMAFGKALYPKSNQPDRNAGMIRLRQCVPIRKWGATIRHAARCGVAVTREQLAAWSQKQAGKQYR